MGVPEVLGWDVPNLMKNIPNFVKDVPRVSKCILRWGSAPNYFVWVSKFNYGSSMFR